MDIIKIIEKININAPIEKVWHVISDIGAIQKYSPDVLRSYCTSDKKKGVGVTRHCDLTSGVTLEERVIGWNKMDMLAIEIYKGEGILLRLLKSLVVKIILLSDNNFTEVTQIMEYKIKNGILGNLLRGFVEKSLDKSNRHTLVGLKHYIETGEEITQDIFKKLSLIHL